jgi:hypothetical protein
MVPPSLSCCSTGSRRRVPFGHERFRKLRQPSSLLQSASRKTGDGQSSPRDESVRLTDHVPAFRRATFARATARQGKRGLRKRIFSTSLPSTAMKCFVVKGTPTLKAFSRTSRTSARYSRKCSKWPDDGCHRSSAASIIFRLSLSESICSRRGRGCARLGSACRRSSACSRWRSPGRGCRPSRLPS